VNAPVIQGDKVRSVAAIIDPEAFELGADTAIDATIERRREAVRKAELVYDLAGDLILGEILRETLGDGMPAGASGDDLLRASAAEAFPAMLADDGRPVFTGLIKPEADGRLLVATLVAPDAPADDPRWLIEHLDDPVARRLAAEIDVAAAGGGQA